MERNEGEVVRRRKEGERQGVGGRGRGREVVRRGEQGGREVEKRKEGEVVRRRMGRKEGER
jgi:hypothetical protein